MAGRYDEGGAPAVREADANQEYPCPWCAEKKVLVSSGDISDDNYRVQLYCDNSECDVREFEVIAIRTNEPQAHRRADVRALHVVDDGTRAEQEALGVEFTEGGGRVTRMSNFDLEASNAAVLRNRTRQARIDVQPE